MAHHALYLMENESYWAERALSSGIQDIFIIHKLTFQTELTSEPIKSSVAAIADVTLLGSRLQLSLGLNFADPLTNVQKLANAAIEHFKKLFTPRFSKTFYDKPSAESDVELSGT